MDDADLARVRSACLVKHVASERLQRVESLAVQCWKLARAGPIKRIYKQAGSADEAEERSVCEQVLHDL
jgi:hypothetical protein